uniref:Thioredoxin n=2 Tax=Acrobeloides nanus TaxID=290746 RepID=A0A914EC40_9BILA
MKGFNVGVIDAEGVPDVSLAYGITAAPTVVIFKDGKEVEKLNGFHPTEVKNAITKHSFGTGIVKESEPEVKEDLNERLKRLINHSRLTLFMKGSTGTERIQRLADISPTIFGW